MTRVNVNVPLSASKCTMNSVNYILRRMVGIGKNDLNVNNGHVLEYKVTVLYFTLYTHGICRNGLYSSVFLKYLCVMAVFLRK